MSEKTQVYLYTLAAFIGGGMIIVYAIKILFWVLLYALTHPVNALISLGAGAVAYYIASKQLLKHR